MTAPGVIELTGDALATVTTIGANLTVIIGGIWAGREALKKLSALVRLSSTRTVIAAEDKGAEPGTPLDEWSFERARVIFTTAIESEDKTPFKEGMTQKAYKDLTPERRSEYVTFLGAHLKAFDLTLENATATKRDYWTEVIYAALIKHAGALKTRPFTVSPALAPIIEAVKQIG